MDRRTVLGGAATLGSALLAGCYSPGKGAGDPADREVAPPEIPELDKEKWELLDDPGTRKMADVGIGSLDVSTPYNRTVVYEFIPVRKKVERLTLGEFESNVVVFFASRIAIDGADWIAQPALLRKKAAESIIHRMKEMGVSAVRKTNDLPQPDEVNTGETAWMMDFSGFYEQRNIPFTITIPRQGERTFRFKRVQVDVKARAGIWRRNGQLFIAGGAYPTGSIRKSKPISITGGLGQGIDVDIRLNISFSSYQQQIERMLKSVR